MPVVHFLLSAEWLKALDFGREGSLVMKAVKFRALVVLLLGAVMLDGCLIESGELDHELSTDEFGVEAARASEVVWAVPSDDDFVDGDPMKIVDVQRARLQEFSELTRRALLHRPLECDTEMREEVDGEVIPVTVYLPEQPFDFRRFRGVRDVDTRRAIIEERKEQLRPFQEAIARRIDRFGGVVTNYEYVLNAVDADIPVCELDALIALSGIVGVEVEESQPVPMYVDGIQRRAALGLPAAGHSIFDGALGSTQSPRNAVHYGVIEVDDAEMNSGSQLNAAHSSFKLGPTGTRVIDTDRCLYWFPSYRCINSAVGDFASHGTLVTSVILGDYSRGQSLAVSGTTERYRRSGVAPRATVHYYSIKSGWRQVRTGVKESSLEDGVDIINMSVGATDSSTWCTSPTLSGTREALEAAIDAGVVAVASAGNYGAKPQSCTVSPSASYSVVISVGGTGAAASLSALEGVTRAPNSSHGARTLSISGGRVVSTQFVDVMANNCHSTMAGAGADGMASACGTSFASPTVAGVVGLIKHWVAVRGGLPQGMADDPIAIRTILSLMGDGRGFNVDRSGDKDSQFGYGNVRFVDFDSDIGASGSWGIHRVSTNTGSVHEWNIGALGVESSNLKGFKAVAIADRTVYEQSPDVSFQLIDKCTSSPNGTAVFTATRSALQWRMRSLDVLVDYFLRDRCLWLRATTSSAAGPTNLYVAWVLYSNERARHDASNQ